MRAIISNFAKKRRPATFDFQRTNPESGEGSHCPSPSRLHDQSLKRCREALYNRKHDGNSHHSFRKSPRRALSRLAFGEWPKLRMQRLPDERRGLVAIARLPRAEFASPDAREMALSMMRQSWRDAKRSASMGRNGGAAERIGRSR